MTCCFNPPGAPRATAQRRGAQNERTLYFAHDTKEAPTFLPPLPFIFSGTSWHFAKSFYLASAHVPVANVERALDREVPEALGEDVIPDVITSSVAPRVWAPVRGHPWGASTSGATLFPGRRAVRLLWPVHSGACSLVYHGGKSASGRWCSFLP